ncbi:MAG: hypothetical protein ACKVY0_07815 [Prosthecobacter sp.]|uniref:hypothetical protein n=1 Tax=Prosthecobacter sp. TaxID=1965333 RepID=UPI0038FFE78B
MTATQLIAEIDRLPQEEKEQVFMHVHELEETLIPESFLQGMAEARRGELLDMEDQHFQFPPV